MRRARVGAAFASGCCVLLACATASVGRSWTLPTGQQCREEVEDRGVVPLQAVMTGMLAGLNGIDGDSPDTLLITVSYDSTGARSSVRAYARPGVSFDSAAARPLEGLFVERSTPATHAHALLVQSGGPELVQHRPTTECPPALLNRGQIRELLNRLAANPAALDRGAMILLFVGTDGVVHNAMVHRSSGSIQVDREMVQIARQGRFAPALYDGFVVPVWVSIPLDVRAQPEPTLDRCPPGSAATRGCRW